MASKKTVNPGTGKYFKKRQRNTDSGTKDEVTELWKQPAQKKEKEKK
jgi:hypothetical protein